LRLLLNCHLGMAYTFIYYIVSYDTISWRHGCPPSTLNIANQEFSTHVQRVGIWISSYLFSTCNDIYNVIWSQYYVLNFVLSSRSCVGTVLRAACQRCFMFRRCLYEHYKLYLKLSANVRLTPIINIYTTNIKHTWDTGSRDNMTW